MHAPATPYADPQQVLIRQCPDDPVMIFCPAELQATAYRFQAGFDGLVTYAVKANDRAEVLQNLSAAGLRAFDVASPAEMAAVRAVDAGAVLHYNNPVRSKAEIAQGIAMGVASWSVDEAGELAKLAEVPCTAEIAVRFKLPVTGAAYDFGDKFGATPEQAVDLLKAVAAQGWTPALCFHPGTQCADPAAWTTYIDQAARIAQRAGVRIARLNVGGGFAAHRVGAAPDLQAIFEAIRTAVAQAFGATPPQLICEPGRAMVAESFVLATRVKSLRENGHTVYLNDGIYGGLRDLHDSGPLTRVLAVAPDGTLRRGTGQVRQIFGPTCDSIDKLPDGLRLPDDLQVGDYVLFQGMGAYSLALNSRFNGYGINNVATVLSLSGHSDARQ